ncbi:hypothetical protein MPTK1_1g16060 [Marchantia polymorpha subsp. ruderalis]|uniref:Uncharacterized protein n=2 Tax=Marchantia polymorpha TaxID=3197 RepID=A0AAF6AQP3_MARPO|nr:hypothetical protein MARPO_0033s0054 [Marchantia polymorpha]BBM98763.1 hypothetical protein Mp_1g16060 [Marchantia polymorpha subsp. ruderalis]|eukprot:PTQ41641.1 hypothetical protein MARPO_0033s0054 [Marchantia polymorpha]
MEGASEGGLEGGREARRAKDREVVGGRNKLCPLSGGRKVHHLHLQLRSKADIRIGTECRRIKSPTVERSSTPPCTQMPPGISTAIQSQGSGSGQKAKAMTGTTSDIGTNIWNLSGWLQARYTLHTGLTCFRMREEFKIRV